MKDSFENSTTSMSYGQRTLWDYTETWKTSFGVLRQHHISPFENMILDDDPKVPESGTKLKILQEHPWAPSENIILDDNPQDS